MVPEIIGVIDRIIALLKGRAVARRQLFQDFLEPMFADLEPIHRDYQEAFCLLATQLEDESMPHSELVAALRLRRQELLPLRDKLRLLIGTISSAHNTEPWLPEEAKRFFRMVHDYYNMPFAPCPFPGRSTHIGNFIDMPQLVVIDPASRQNVADRADDFAIQLSDCWQVLADAYARAKVACLK